MNGKSNGAYTLLCCSLAAMLVGGNLAHAEDIVLMCEEISFDDVRLYKTKPGSTEFSRLIDFINGRNNNPKRPYFALKYVKGKLSYNSNGVAFLDNDTLGQKNALGWAGEINIGDDSIRFEQNNVSAQHLQTSIKIDRYTGLYRALQFSPNGEELHHEMTGKCKKYSERQF